MNTLSRQESLDLTHQEILEFKEPLYYRNEKCEIGVISHLALEAGDWQFKANPEQGNIYKLTHDTGLSFLAELKKGSGISKGTYQIKGNVQNTINNLQSYFEDVRINGAGESGDRGCPRFCVNVG